MGTIDLLRKKINQLTSDLHTLVKENKQLKAKIDYLENKNNILTRKSEDLLLTIHNKLRNKGDRN